MRFSYATVFAFWFERKKGRRKKGAARFQVTAETTFRPSNGKGEPKVYDPIVEIEEMRPGDSFVVEYSIEDGGSESYTHKKVTVTLLPPT